MVVAGVRGCAEPHTTEVLIHPAVDALSPRHGLIGSQHVAVGSGIDRRGTVGISEVCADRAGRGDHGCNGHVASDGGDQMLRQHMGRSRRGGLFVLVVLKAGTGRTEDVNAIVGSGRGMFA